MTIYEISEIIARIADNTFIGTLLAGIVTASVGLRIYHKQKKIDREVEEIRELNNKTHDRLVEIEIEIESNKQSEKFPRTIIGLYYSASRLRKCNKKTSENIYNLLKLLPLKFKKYDKVINATDIITAKKLINDIKDGIDKLWLEKNYPNKSNNLCLRIFRKI